MSNFLLNLQSVCDSSKTDDTFVFFPLQERPLQEKSRSADADVAGMARYCNAIPDKLENLPDFSFQKDNGSISASNSPLSNISKYSLISLFNSSRLVLQLTAGHGVLISLKTSGYWRLCKSTVKIKHYLWLIEVDY